MKIKSICTNQWQKKEALFKQTALVKAANVNVISSVVYVIRAMCSPEK